MIQRRILLVLWGACMGFAAFGQYGVYGISAPSAVVPSGALGLDNVNLHTGAVGVHIPMLALEGHNVSSAVSISYNTSGIKVAERSGTVGHGWQLNAGGSITVEVKGIPDAYIYGGYRLFRYGMDYCLRPANKNDYSFGLTSSADIYNTRPTIKFLPGNNNYYWTTENVSVAYTAAAWRRYHLQKIYARNFLGSLESGDLEPDIFHFSFDGYSGKFVIDENRVVHLIPHQNLDVQLTKGPFAVTEKIVFRTPDGRRYEFATYETTQNFSDGLCTKAVDDGYISKYHLDKVLSASGKDSLVFEYATNGDKAVETRINKRYALLSTNAAANNSILLAMQNSIATSSDGSNVRMSGYEEQKISIFSKTIAGKRLTKITSSNGRIDLAYDFIGAANAYYLRTATQYTGDGQAVRNVVLAYTLWAVPDDPETDRRYFLASVKECGATTSSCKPPYTFAYCNQVGTSTVLLPSVFSADQDHWGYYNGMGNGITYVPRIDYPGVPYAGADKKPMAAYAQIGTLEKITYPTGGYTQFTYEGNTYYDAATATNKAVGGIRLLKKEDDDGAGKKITQNYSYGQQGDAQKSSGSIDGLPIYHREIVVQAPTDFTSEPNATQKTVTAETFRLLEVSSSPIVEYGSTQGSPVGYGCVTVAETNKGKTVYLYSSFSDKPDNPNDANDCDYVWNNTAGHTFPSGPTTCYVPKNSRESERGLLLCVQQYDNAGNLKRKQTNVYSVLDVSQQGFYGPNRCNAYQNLDVPALRANVNYYMYNAPNGKGKLHMAHPQLQGNPIMGYWGTFNLKSQWVRLDSTMEELYDQLNTGNKITSGTKYEYSPGNLLVNKSTMTNSDGRKLVTATTYPFDYGSSGTGTDDLLPLKSKYLAGLPVEKVSYEILPNGTAYLLSGELNEYNALGLLAAKYELELPKPLLVSGFKFSNNNTVGALPPAQPAMRIFNFGMYDYLGPNAPYYPPNDPRYPYIYTTHHSYSKDSRYIRKATFQYDGKENLVQVQPWASNTMAALPSCNILDAAGNNIIASVANGAADMCAFTGFEGNDMGGWANSSIRTTTSDAKTGKSCFDRGLYFTYNFTKPSPSGKYKLSFWAKYTGAFANPSVKVGYNNGAAETVINLSKNGWNYYELLLDNQKAGVKLHPLFYNGDIGNIENVLIDDLRIHPSDALMTTYTHQPLVGVTSTTDANNVQTYYEYDVLNRPYLVRDQDKYVLKKTTYGYKLP